MPLLGDPIGHDALRRFGGRLVLVLLLLLAIVTSWGEGARAWLARLVGQ